MKRPTSWKGWLALFVAGCLIGAATTGCNLLNINQTAKVAKVDPTTLPRATVVHVHGMNLTVVSQFATPAERAHGLMGRGARIGTAAVFVWGQSTNDGFWMKDTPTDLAVLWVSAGKAIGSANMIVCKISCPTYGAPGPYDTAIEAALHTFDRVRAGDPVTFS